MFDDNIANWQSLTDLYGEMGDQELLELDAQLGDLTELAQQVLRDEMKKRGLSRQRLADNEPKPIERIGAPQWDDGSDSSMADDETEDRDRPIEYTWKTLLCECTEREETAPIRLALRQAGIESWTQRPGFQILVAADQLEQAREVIAQPIPQAIIEQSKTEIPEYLPPVCPKCGAEDPVLENADPVNSWLCEECGKQWTDPSPE
jgi:hypothetical protein